MSNDQCGHPIAQPEVAPRHSGLSTLTRYPIEQDPEIDAAMARWQRAMQSATTPDEVIAALTFPLRDSVLSRPQHWTYHARPEETKRERRNRLRRWQAERGVHRGELVTESVRERRKSLRADQRSRRDEIRDQQPGQHRGPPEPDPLIHIFDRYADLFAALREETVAALAKLKEDRWLSQRESPLPPRCFTRLCRRLIDEGDPRAAVRSRIHYLKQSAIDEHLRGAPKAAKAQRAVQRSAGAALLAELGLG